ncbi:MAG: hypothetical protein R2856_27195 [Caldilineaceae bacterium]
MGIDLAAIAPWLAGLAAIPLVIFLARPGWLLGLLNLALVRVGRSPLDVSLGSAQLLRLLLVAVGDWLLWGASFAALTASLDGDVLAQGVRVGALPSSPTPSPMPWAISASSRRAAWPCARGRWRCC